MTREEARNELVLWRNRNSDNGYHYKFVEALTMAIKALEQSRWIPVKWHEITDEERKREGYPKEWLTLLDCEMPDDGEEILITDKKGFVSMDECQIDDGYYLDSGWDWIDDVIAWMPLPQPYKESEGK